MPKKTPPSRLVIPLLTLLAIVGTAFVAKLPSTLADSLSSLSTSPKSTLCVGNNNSNMPNSDCNTNTPDPSKGECQLAWANGGGGTVALDVNKVTDKGLRDTLGGYNLRCAADVKASSCTLTSGANDSGNTKLDLANVMNRSPWIYQQLNGKFGLNCNKNGTLRSVNAPNSPDKYSYIVSALDSNRVVGTLNGQTQSGTAIVADKKSNTPTDSQLWKFVSDKENDKYGYLQSKVVVQTNNGSVPLVLDIKGGQTTAGTPVIASTKKSSEADNQLWQFVPDGLNGGLYGYWQSKSKQGNSNLVLDISHSSPDLNKPLIASSKDQPISPNQIWIKVP